MRIKKEDKIRPRLGTIRTINKFLWKSLTLKNESRWLENAKIIQIYAKVWNIFDDSPAPDYQMWIPIGWADSKSIENIIAREQRKQEFGAILDCREHGGSNWCIFLNHR